MCENEPFVVVRVGLIGCGTVGAAFIETLQTARYSIVERYGVWLELSEVAVAHPERVRPVLYGLRVHGDGAVLAADRDLDIVVEASTAPEAGAWMRAALDRGAAVVSANKAAVAGAGGNATASALLADTVAAARALVRRGVGSPQGGYDLEFNREARNSAGGHGQVVERSP
jgi:homoserine dehydrogenase